MLEELCFRALNGAAFTGSCYWLFLYENVKFGLLAILAFIDDSAVVLIGV